MSTGNVCFCKPRICSYFTLIHVTALFLFALSVLRKCGFDRHKHGWRRMELPSKNWFHCVQNRQPCSQLLVTKIWCCSYKICHIKIFFPLMKTVWSRRKWAKGTTVPTYHQYPLRLHLSTPTECLSLSENLFTLETGVDVLSVIYLLREASIKYKESETEGARIRIHD